ncbi:MAG TPA: imidazolonepropionase, partial [Gemmatimonadaceae bacterium]
MARRIIFHDASQVATCAGPARGRRGAEMSEAAIQTGVAIAIDDGHIAAVGAFADIERDYPDAEYMDCAGRVVTPGLVDSHTHAVFGRPRYDEQELRAAGLGYMEIAEQGGGIHSSVRDLRARSEDDLLALARVRLARLAQYGATTIEIKSGYGLALEDELKSLRVVASLQSETNLRLVPTWLGAHEIPREYRGRVGGRTEYIEQLIHEQLPRVAAERLAVFADVFCEPGVFTLDETRTILAAARARGLMLKLHADELEPCGGAELAASLGATSADHLAAISPAGIAALARSDTVATLLPGTMLFLGRERQAPARELIGAGAIVALATDFNPGTSPT